MKKIICILICLLVFIQLNIGIVTESNRQIKNLTQLENRFCESFSIPDLEAIDNPEKVCRIVKTTARQHHADIIRSLITDSGDHQYEIMKFLYLSNETSALSFLNDRNYVKNINSYMYNFHLSVKSLDEQSDYFKSTGLYYIELPDTESKADFIQDLKQGLEDEFHITLKNSDFRTSQITAGIPYANLDFYYFVKILIFFLILLCCAYYYFRESKQIAIHNLFGISENKTTILLQKDFYLSYYLTLLLCGAALFIYNRNLQYIWNILWPSVILSLILFAVMFFLGVFFQRNSKISASLTGKNYAKYILYCNYCIKILCTIVLFYIGGSIYNDYKSYIAVQERYTSWKTASHYGVFYPLYTGYDLTDQETSITEKNIGLKLYPKLNSQGALFINSRSFEQEALKLNGNRTWMTSITVNPNYLKQFPVLEADGKQISISEKETDWIIIVPEKYQKRENEIRKSFLEDRQSSFEIARDDYHESLSSTLTSQKIQIIWMKNNQKIFSFNPDVCPDQNNMISEPVIQVMTLNNSCSTDRDCIQGNGTTDPLKLPISGSSKETYDSLKPILNRFQLDDNLKHIISVNEEISQQLHLITSNLQLSFLMLAGAFMIWFLNLFQNTFILFDHHKKDFLIKKISGWNSFSIYGIYYYRKLIVLFFITLLMYLLKPIDHLSVYYYIYMYFLIIFIETITFFACIRYSEHHKIIETLKGD